MVDTRTPLAATGGASHRGRTLLVVASVVVLVVVVAGFFAVRDLGRSVPQFPSLTERPDPLLHGTVAYFAEASRCVRIVAAAGQPSKDVLCLPQPDMTKAEALGTKEDGPQLVWRADGRLEVTMFRNDPKSGTFSAGWQKIVDVATGQAEDVPASTVPATPNLETRPTVSPTGQQITTSSDAQSGRIKVMLTDASGTRTLLSARGPGEYTYGLRTAFWAPGWQWIAAADDGRILVITPGQPAVTRILTTGVGGLYGDDEQRLAGFAVTSTDLLAGLK